MTLDGRLRGRGEKQYSAAAFSLTRLADTRGQIARNLLFVTGDRVTHLRRFGLRYRILECLFYSWCHRILPSSIRTSLTLPSTIKGSTIFNMTHIMKTSAIQQRVVVPMHAFRRHDLRLTILLSVFLLRINTVRYCDSSIVYSITYTHWWTRELHHRRVPFRHVIYIQETTMEEMGTSNVQKKKIWKGRVMYFL